MYNAIRSRNLLLAISAALFAIASFQGFLHQILAIGLVWITLITAATFFVAKGIREFAELIVPGGASPWYARPGGFVFLLLSLPLVSYTVLTVADTAGRMSFPVPPVPPGLGMFFACMALSLFWLILLDWPHQPVYRQPPAQYPNRPPFKQPPPLYFDEQPFDSSGYQHPDKSSFDPPWDSNQPSSGMDSENRSSSFKIRKER